MSNKKYLDLEGLQTFWNGIKDELSTKISTIMLSTTYPAPTIKEIYDEMIDELGTSLCIIQCSGFVSTFGVMQIRSYGAINGHCVYLDLSNNTIYDSRKFNEYDLTTLRLDTVVNEASPLTTISDLEAILENYALSSSIPATTSALVNDSGFITNSVNNLTNYTLSTGVGSKINVSIDNTTYVMTLKLLNSVDSVLSTQTIDLPLETMVVSARYEDGKLYLTLKNGTELDGIDISNLISGLVPDTRTINGKALSSDVTLTTSDLSNTSDYTTKSYVDTSLSNYVTLSDLQIIDGIKIFGTLTDNTTVQNSNIVCSTINMNDNSQNKTTISSKGITTDSISAESGTLNSLKLGTSIPSKGDGSTVYFMNDLVTNRTTSQASGFYVNSPQTNRLFYLHENSKYICTCNYKGDSTDAVPTDSDLWVASSITNSQTGLSWYLGRLFDGSLSEGAYFPIASLATRPLELTIKTTDGSRIDYSDVSYIMLLGHRFDGKQATYCYSGYLNSYSIQVLIDYENDTWVETLSRNGVNDSIQSISIPTWSSLGGTSGYESVYGIKLIVNEASQGTHPDAMFGFSQIRLMETRPSGKPSDSVSALGLQGGTLYGDVMLSSKRGSGDYTRFSLRPSDSDNQNRLGHENYPWRLIYGTDMHISNIYDNNSEGYINIRGDNSVNISTGTETTSGTVNIHSGETIIGNDNQKITIEDDVYFDLNDRGINLSLCDYITPTSIPETWVSNASLIVLDVVKFIKEHNKIMYIGDSDITYLLNISQFEENSLIWLRGQHTFLDGSNSIVDFKFEIDERDTRLCYLTIEEVYVPSAGVTLTRLI